MLIKYIRHRAPARERAGSCLSVLGASVLSVLGESVLSVLGGVLSVLGGSVLGGWVEYYRDGHPRLSRWLHRPLDFLFTFFLDMRFAAPFSAKITEIDAKAEQK